MLLYVIGLPDSPITFFSFILFLAWLKLKALHYYFLFSIEAYVSEILSWRAHSQKSVCPMLQTTNCGPQCTGTKMAHVLSFAVQKHRPQSPWKLFIVLWRASRGLPIHAFVLRGFVSCRLRTHSSQWLFAVLNTGTVAWMSPTWEENLINLTKRGVKEARRCWIQKDIKLSKHSVT